MIGRGEADRNPLANDDGMPTANAHAGQIVYHPPVDGVRSVTATPPIHTRLWGGSCPSH